MRTTGTSCDREEALGYGSTESLKVCMNGVRLKTSNLHLLDASETQINLESAGSWTSTADTFLFRVIVHIYF